MKKVKEILAAAIMFLSVFSGCTKTENISAEEVLEVTSSARVSVDGTKFMVDDKELWINGVNTPWQNWNDFNGNMDSEQWDNTFAQLKADGINCTRIWINCSGENIIVLTKEGKISVVNEGHWTDLDKLFEIAAKYKVYVMPTLLSFDHFKGESTSAEKWRKLISSKETADSFAENYVKEFCTRYASNEYLFAIDIMNEPDWVFENEECGQLDWSYLSYFFGKCASVIHENSDVLVTVGLGIIKYNSDKYDGNKISDAYLKELTGDEKAYVDFYSTHYYLWQKSWFGFPFNVSPVEFGLDGTKPSIIAETSNDDEKQIRMTLEEKYKTSYEKGWNGIMVWMEYRSDGTSGCDSMWYRYDLTKTATKAMYEFIPEKIFPNENKQTDNSVFSNES